MRLLLALAVCVALSAGDLARLRELEDNNRMFSLRAELDQHPDNAGEVLLYRAIRMSGFGSEQEAVDQLRKFLGTKPAPDLERKAHLELSWAWLRLGDYRQAAAEISIALRIAGGSPEARADHENERRALEGLSDVAKQTVEPGPPTSIQARRNPLGLWEAPVEISSQRGEWILDTGANYSTVTESEARRIGLAIREVRISVSDFAGAKHPTRLAVAGELRFGAARIRNVVFLVLPDESLLIPGVKYQIRGIIGLPVLRALECVEVSADGAITFGKGDPAGKAPANLFFDGLNPIVQVGHSGHDLQMMLDTGAAGTVLYPSILAAFAQWEHDQLKGSNPASAGGSEQQPQLVPFIQLEAGGRSVYLERPLLFRKVPPGVKGRDGVLGIDALKGGFRIDFRAMRFTLK